MKPISNKLHNKVFNPFLDSIWYTVSGNLSDSILNISNRSSLTQVRTSVYISVRINIKPTFI